jgi:fumarate hydratase class II
MRSEEDSMGSIHVPANALWGAATARSLLCFAIRELRMSHEITRALARIKQAWVNPRKMPG